MTEFGHIIVAGIALFLIGANGAFLLHLGARLVPWFTFKIVAVTIMLAYVAASAIWGNPQSLRLGLGFIAVVIDVWALFRMWTNITDARLAGRVGLVPLLRPEDEDRVH